MSEVDIREGVATPIKTIRFSDDIISGTTVASILAVAENLYDNRLEIRDACFNNYRSSEGYLVVSNKDHALNLIKALEYAIELGFLK